MSQPGKTIALVVAAGSGSRFGGETPKQYRHVAGKAILAHAVERLRHPAIAEIRVVIGEGQQALYDLAVGEHRLPSPIIGGPSRRQSVLNGLEALAAEPPARVLIHDAARPFLPMHVLDSLIAGLESAEGAVPTLPVADSLARAGANLGGPVDRQGLVRVQTPQAFHFQPILEAHRSWADASEATDDAQVARAAGMSVATVPGDTELDKLTYESDFARIDRLAATGLVSRTASGFDVHGFCEGDHLWLGGVRIDHSRGLSGHSDADVVLHALTDALLGAIAAGDIGEHFPPSDARWRGAASSRFLEHARVLIEERGGRIDHVDVTVICETPRLGPHKAAMQASIAGLLRLPSARVSIKATTTEKLGFTGRGEGIAAQALATVRLREE